MPADLPGDRAIIDRIEGGVAVLLVGPDGGRHEVATTDLPDGAVDGDVVEVAVTGGAVTVGAVDRPLTDARRTDAQQRLSRILKERDSGRFS
ncbi:MAG: DUF3006 domain-containing protein [Nitriliruptoraceae bacterium]